MSINDKNIPVIVAELINRMSPEEKDELISNLDSHSIQSLQKIKEQKTNQDNFSEPEIYVRVTSGYVSFEMPKAKVIEFVIRLSDLLKPKKIIVRYSKNGTTVEQNISPSRLLLTLEKIREELIHGVVTFEFGPHTLFSTGSGCMLFETNLPSDKKRNRIGVFETLRPCY